MSASEFQEPSDDDGWQDYTADGLWKYKWETKKEEKWVESPTGLVPEIKLVPYLVLRYFAPLELDDSTEASEEQW